MKLLILGGTRFLGRHLAQQALDAGHHVTLLHRGRSATGLFPQAEHRIGDRDTDIGAALAGGTWDAVIDTSAYFPRQVRQAAAVLAGRVGHYQLVSSISAYERFDPKSTPEDAPLRSLDDAERHTTVTGENYGGLKALCEAKAQRAFGSRCLIVRPGLLVGPHDPTGRFTWWVQRFVRAARGDDEVLAPGDPQAPLQYIDGRDAAAWMLGQATGACTGTFNLTGPAHPLTMGGLLSEACRVLAPAARLLWVDEDFLLARDVAPWIGLPMWLRAQDAGLHRVAIEHALAKGLRCRPLAQTLADTAAWAGAAATAVQEGPLRPLPGLAPEREAALRAAWRERSATA